jgi:alcohol dehydrogenase
LNKLRVFGPVGRLLNAGEVVVGPGSLGVLPAVGAARLAALVSASVSNSDYFQSLVRRLQARTAVQVFVMPSGEPVWHQLSEVVRGLGIFSPDWILAAGGGSVLDGAKIAWACYEQPDTALEATSRPFSLPPLRGKCRFIAAPTTNGSGSDASSSAIFQSAEGSRKGFLVSHELLPDVVILDPRLAIDVPADVIAASGMDALAHALEGYISRFANPLSDELAIASAGTLLRWLRAGVERRGDLEVRARLMAAAYHAGCVQNVALPGIGHAVAHQLSALGVSHGRATGSLLEHALQWSARDSGAAARVADLAGVLGFSSVSALVREISALRLALGLSLDLQGSNWVELARNEEFLSGVFGDPCARASLRSVDTVSLIEFLEGVES